MSGLLSHSPQYIVRQLLVDLGMGFDPVGTSTSWRIYDTSEPDSPDDAITVYSTQGVDHGQIQISGYRVIDHGIQIRVRARDPEAGFVKANQIAVALDETVRMNTTVLGETVYLIWAFNRTGDLNQLGRMPNRNCYLFTINATVTLNPVN